MVVAGGVFTGLGAFSGVYVWFPHHRTVDITPPSGVSRNFSKAIAIWQPPLSHMEVPPTPTRKDQNETDSFTVLASSRSLCANIHVAPGGEEMPHSDHPLASSEVGAIPPYFPARPVVLGLEVPTLVGGCLGLILFLFTYQVLIHGFGFHDWVISRFQYLLASITWFVRVRICGLFQKREDVFKSELAALRRELRKLNSPRYRVAQEGRRLRTLRRMRYVQAQVAYREVAREFKGHNAHWHTIVQNKMESLRQQLKDYTQLDGEVLAKSAVATVQEKQLRSQIDSLTQLEKELDEVMGRVTVALPKCRESAWELEAFQDQLNRLVKEVNSVGKTVRGAENAIISLQGIASRLQEPDISDKIRWVCKEADEIEEVIYRGREAMVRATSWEKANVHFDSLNADAAMAKDAPPLLIHCLQLLRSWMGDKEQPFVQSQSADRPVSPLEGPGPVGPSTKRQRVECSPPSSQPARVIAQPRRSGRRSTSARAPVPVPLTTTPLLGQLPATAPVSVPLPTTPLVEQLPAPAPQSVPLSPSPVVEQLPALSCGPLPLPPTPLLKRRPRQARAPVSVPLTTTPLLEQLPALAPVSVPLPTTPLVEQLPVLAPASVPRPPTPIVEQLPALATVSIPRPPTPIVEQLPALATVSVPLSPTPMVEQLPALAPVSVPLSPTPTIAQLPPSPPLPSLLQESSQLAQLEIVPLSTSAEPNSENVTDALPVLALPPTADLMKGTEPSSVSAQPTAEGVSEVIPVSVSAPLASASASASERAPEPEPTLSVPEPERAPEPEPTLSVPEPERAPEPEPTLSVPEPERAPEPEPTHIVPEPQLAAPVPESVPEQTPPTLIPGLTLLAPGPPTPALPAPAPVPTLRAPVTMQSLSGHMPAYTLPAHIPANARLLRSQGIFPFPTRPPPARPNRPAPAQTAPASAPSDAMEDTVPLDLANNYKEESMVDVPATAASGPSDAMEDTVPLDLANNYKEESMVDASATSAAVPAPVEPVMEDAVPLLLSHRTTPMIDAPPLPEPMPVAIPAPVPVAANSTETATTKAPSARRAAPAPRQSSRINCDVVQAILMAEPVPAPPPGRKMKKPISRLKNLKGKGKSWANSNSPVASASASALAAALAPSGPSSVPLASAPAVSAPVTTSEPAPVITSEPAPAAPPKSPDRVSKLLAEGDADLNDLLLAERSGAESNDEVDPAADYNSDWDGVEDRGGEEEDPEEEARAARWDAHQAHLVELSRKRQGLDAEVDAEVAEEQLKEDSSSDEDSETDSEEDRGWQPRHGDGYDSDYPSGSD